MLLFSNSGAKLLQIFEIYKDFTVKNKFIYDFSGKFLLFAQLCGAIVPLWLRTNFGETLHS